MILLALTAPAFGQIESPEAPSSAADRIASEFERREKSSQLQAQAVTAFESGDYTLAEEIFEKQAEVDPGNFTVHFNLACVRAVQGDADEAMQHLVDAVKTGFVDAYQLRRDPSLASLQNDPRLHAMLDHWPRIIDAHRAANTESAQRWIGEHAEHRTLHALRIECISNHDAISTDAAVRELELVAAFAHTIIPDIHAADPLDPWVVVALPDQRHFMTWSISTFGPSARQTFSQIGGAYDHDARRLVAMDLGATLRHEFFHVLHWRDMSRRGVVAPIWIQEGLASLVEDCEVRGGAVKPVPSWRTNIAKRLEKNGRLPPIEELTQLSHERFSSTRPLRQYALARTFFLYLLDRGVLAPWYQRTAAGDADDPSGLKALSKLLDQTPEQIHADYRKWVSALPMVPENSDDLDVTMGMRLETGIGEGPVILGFTIAAVRTESGLKLRDTITAIDGQSTRDLQELIRVLGGTRPGQSITIDYRRGKLAGQTTLTLRERVD
ncbi:MAG: PDZ domain-containing protein [Phycisphaerales bacterium]|nr:PDZ domain-containing protein [Phycisphaerales bacterium]